MVTDLRGLVGHWGGPAPPRGLGVADEAAYARLHSCPSSDKRADDVLTAVHRW